LQLDHWVAACLVPLAVWILISGLDDLWISLVHLFTRREPFPWPAESDLDQAGERPIAILVPLWQEHRVIGAMLERNLSTIRYRNYTVFVGIYPNDPLTARAAAGVARRHPRVQLTQCPRKGPTSKGDCLNWIYRSMRDYEERHGVRFEVVVTHDAEDLIHADSLRLINWFSRRYEMVQVPVLPLPTGGREFTHGLYCDEFAEFQTKDIPVRQRLHGFLPANGVGTGFAREALDRLAEVHQGHAFDPECLTEDYENGFRLNALGYRQLFVPLRFDFLGPMATREYFPRKWRPAVRQRSRWVVGIALQGWQNHGWRGSWQQIYWFWRDRKGLVGNLISPLVNLVCLYSTASYLCVPAGQPWHLGSHIPLWASRICFATCWIALVQMGMRFQASARVYGWRFATGVPVRMLWGNLVNCAATAAALKQFSEAQWRRETLVWRKTEHVYPMPAKVSRARLGEVLIRLRYLSTSEIEEALRSQPTGTRLGEYLLQLHMISENNLYQALSSQAGIPLGPPAKGEVNRLATRVIPAETARRWKVMPYRVDPEHLHMVTAEVPSEDLCQALAEHSALDIRFRLVKPREFDEMAREYLPPCGS
jgi:adsorption protein B